MNELGSFLEQLRGKMSLRKAAERSGLSHAYIRDLELGINRSTKTPLKPSPETLRKLADAYNHSYQDLLERAGYSESEHVEQLGRENALAFINIALPYITRDSDNRFFPIVEKELEDFVAARNELPDFEFTPENLVDLVANHYTENKSIIWELVNELNSLGNRFMGLAFDMPQLNKKIVLKLDLWLEQGSIEYKGHTLTESDRRFLIDMLNRMYPDHS